MIFQEIGLYGARAAEAFLMCGENDDDDHGSEVADVAVTVLAEFGIGEDDSRYDDAADWFFCGWEYVVSGDTLADAA